MTAPEHQPKVLLTGAAGHLGRHIARCLASIAGGLALSDIDAGRLADAAGWIAAGKGGRTRSGADPRPRW